MTIENLTQIIFLGNEKMIVTELKRLNYTDCERNKQDKHISLLNCEVHVPKYALI